MDSGEARHGRLFRLGVLVLMPLAGFAVLLPMLRVPFDTETASRYITPFMFQSGSDLEWAMTESVPIGIFRPLYGLSFLLDYSIWGGRQLGYHLTDLLLTWGAFAMAFALFSRRFDRWTASLAVSLWIMLPVQFQSMFHFYGRNDRLMIYFLLGALLVYDRTLGRAPGRGRNLALLLSGVILSLGLFTKESVFYYGFVLFAWSVMAAGRSFRVTLLKDWPLWVSVFAMAALYLGARALLGIRPGDDNEMDTGMVYLSNLGQMVAWGFPFRLPVSLNRWIGVAAWGASIGLLLLRRIPGEIRFGGFCLLVGFLHIPIFWIQRSFLWIPWLFGSLAAAGGVVRLLAWVRGRWPASGGVFTVMIPLALLGASGLWSLLECRSWSRESLAIDSAVCWLLESGPGPAYSGSLAVAQLPEFQDVWVARAMDRASERKLWDWMSNLARIRSGRGDIVVVWEAR